MSRWRSILGIVLIVLSLLALIFWELQGRELFLMERVLVATDEIPAGTKVTVASFDAVPVPKEAMIEGALSRRAAAALSGKYAKERILKNQQVAEDSFSEERRSLEGEESIFVVPREWIAMRSSALRRGDRAAFYGNTTCGRVGSYQIAFVKDDKEQEVAEPEGVVRRNALDRVSADGEIDHLEIVTNLAEYEKLRETATVEDGFLVILETVGGGGK